MEQRLKQQIEQMVGKPLRVAGDFVRLSERLEQRTRQRVSASTLRRFWGYDSEGVQPRRYTLDVLARFVGYRSFEDFCGKNGSGEVQSGLVLADKVTAAELCVGERLRLTWLPDRVCVVEHQGDGRFTVVEARNTRLSVGDTFEASVFIAHEPLYLDCLRHDGSAPSVYVVGKKDGITLERLAAAEA